MINYPEDNDAYAMPTVEDVEYWNDLEDVLYEEGSEDE